MSGASFQSPYRAFSLLEILIVVSAVAILGAVAVSQMGSRVQSGSRNAKLQSDLATINSSVATYLAFGGNLDEANSAEEVLTRLKTRASDRSAALMPGATGSFVDQRVEVVMQTEEEAASDLPRAYWNAHSQKFEMATEGGPGIKEFRINPALAGQEPSTEDRGRLMQYASEDTWIWDYQDRTADPPPGPTVIPTTSAPPSSPPPSSPPPPAVPPGPGLNLLAPPGFSIAGGSYPVGDFDLSLLLLDPNPAGAANLVYSLNYAGWQDFTGAPISVSPDTTVQAQSLPVNPTEWQSSGIARQTYAALPAKLAPPVIATSSPTFDPVATPVIAVTITDPNDPKISQLNYRLNGGAWLPYAGTFDVAYADYPSGVQIESYAQATEPGYEDSDPTAAAVPNEMVPLQPPVIEFSADAFGSGATAIGVTLTNPNWPGSSEVLYKIVPVPGGAGAETGNLTYGGVFTVSQSAFPDGFGIKAYAKASATGYEDSREASKFATDVEGLFGGHLDLDTSDFLAEVDHGNTTAHTHDITGKYDLTAIDFFAIPASNQIEINEAITDSGQRFKLTVVNGDLSPGMRVIIQYTDQNGVSRLIDKTVDEYDDSATGGLITFTLGGAGNTARLDGLSIEMGQDVIYQAGVIPTNTGDVKGNTLGKNNEWRNGALTVQAVAVAANGSDAFTTDDSLSSGGHGAATSGLLWEATLFWHWPGKSYQDEDNGYIPGDFSSIEDEVH